MSSSFRTFLQYKKAQPDLNYNERDESYFVLAMLLLRMGLHGTTGHETFEALVANAREEDPLASLQPGVETESALIFISTFLCFFAVKPAAFMHAINQFKNYFIPDFSNDRNKRAQLFQLVNPSFSRSPLHPSQWHTVEHFFREKQQEQVAETAGSY